MSPKYRTRRTFKAESPLSNGKMRTSNEWVTTDYVDTVVDI